MQPEILQVGGVSIAHTISRGSLDESVPEQNHCGAGDVPKMYPSGTAPGEYVTSPGIDVEDAAER
jgi:hypothetical protein